jgi:hypothetical protein
MQEELRAKRSSSPQYSANKKYIEELSEEIERMGLDLKKRQQEKRKMEEQFIIS